MTQENTEHQPQNAIFDHKAINARIEDLNKSYTDDQKKLDSIIKRLSDEELKKLFVYLNSAIDNDGLDKYLDYKKQLISKYYDR